MTDRNISDSFPTHFQRESLDLLNKLLPLDSSAFYLVVADMRDRGVVIRNMPPDTEQDYQDNFRDLDPLNPALFTQSDTRVACIDEQMGEAELMASPYYLGFKVPLGHRHVADRFFRRGEDIVAVLTMLRGITRGPFTDAELDLVRKLQPFLEYTLNTVYLPRRYRQRDRVREKYSLTDRELDVVELIVSGASNKSIARELDLSLATVKTHIQHIFQKAEVPSRTALSARVLGDLGN